MMGAGGVIMPPATYFQQVQAVLQKYDVLLIADEVITGFGRTGEMFGCQSFDIEPDLITVAKGVSAGYMPIGGVLISEPIYQVMLEQSRKIGTFGHGFTYSGHPVCAAVALRALEVYEEDGSVRPCACGLRRTLPPGSWNSRRIRWSGIAAPAAWSGRSSSWPIRRRRCHSSRRSRSEHAWSSTPSTMA